MIESMLGLPDSIDCRSSSARRYMSAGRMKGRALAGDVGDFAVGPGDADLPADHGFGVMDSWDRWVIAATSGPLS